MTVAALNTQRDAAVAALLAGDYATAKQHALAAKLLLSTGMASVSESAGGGSRSMSWDANAIDEFLRECDRMLAGTGGVRTTKITYARPSSSDGY